MKWLTKSGQEAETNDNPANIKAAEAAGWTKAKTKKQRNRQQEGNE